MLRIERRWLLDEWSYDRGQSSLQGHRHHVDYRINIIIKPPAIRRDFMHILRFNRLGTWN